MSEPNFLPLQTSQGLIDAVARQDTTVYRVGYAPSPWEWTPWEYATNGRFVGRWDDPDGVWRTLYCGISALACYLEVLAFARPSPQLVADLDDITVEDDDHASYPTLPPGELPLSWCGRRMLGRGTLTGSFALPTHPNSIATLRSIFRPMAIRHGMDDLDTAALRDGRPRALTQAVSSWMYTLTSNNTVAVDGIEFDSRHGDQLRMWAIYERGHDTFISPLVNVLEHSPIDPDDHQLRQAMAMLGLQWAST